MDLDSVDEKTAFKAGFAAYCDAHGLTVEEAAGRLKTAAAFALPAAWPYILAGGTAIGAGLKSVAGSLMHHAPEIGAASIGIPTAAGLALGGGLGYGAAKLEEPETTPDDIKAQEIAETYRRYTDRLKARRAYQQYRAAR